MTEIIEALRLLVVSYPSFKYLGMFLGAALGGELVLFTFGFLAAQGAVAFLPVVVLGFLGAFSPNVVWFFLGKTNMVNKITSHRYTNGTVTTLIEAVNRISKGNHLIAFVIIKFLVGTPVALTMYINKTNLGFRKFVYYESFAIAISFILLVSLGYLSGLGFNYLADIFKNLYISIGFLLLVIILIVVAQIYFEKRFTRDPRGNGTLG